MELKKQIKNLTYKREGDERCSIFKFHLPDSVDYSQTCQSLIQMLECSHHALRVKNGEDKCFR